MQPLIMAMMVLSLMCLGCRAQRKTQEVCPTKATSGDILDCSVPGFPGRLYTLYTPELKATQPTGVLMVFHGGGGNRLGAIRTTCDGGDLESPACLHHMALKRGLAVIAPDGTPGKLISKMRTWNAGGGTGDFRCVSGRACQLNVDEQAYVRALLKDVGQRLDIDASRIYATGLSNGGAISYRLACQMSDVFAAIAPVGGAMAWAVNHTCQPKYPVPILHTHGTEDPCWRYDGGAPDCPTGQKGLKHVSVAETLKIWRGINQCGGETTIGRLPDREDDGMYTERVDWLGCKAPVTLLKVHQGGHTWPRGQQYMGTSVVGAATRDWGNGVFLDWLLLHRRSQPEKKE